MKLILIAENQAGMLALLTTLAAGHEIMAVVTKTKEIADLGVQLNQNILENTSTLIKKVPRPDLILHVHGREYLNKKVLESPKKGCINIHPCLWKYPGARPVKRLLADGERKASVAAHIMTERVDDGPILIEKFVNIDGLKTEVEVYNRLYYLYPQVINQGIQMMEQT